MRRLQASKTRLPRHSVRRRDKNERTKSTSDALSPRANATRFIDPTARGASREMMFPNPADPLPADAEGTHDADNAVHRSHEYVAE